MKDTELYAALLHLRHPWKVTEVKVDITGGRIDVWIEHAPDTKWLCPECRRSAPLYDHGAEREWRHLDTCDCKTFVHTRPPRVQCKEHGVRQIGPTWADPGSHYTLKFESHVIDTLKECDVMGATRLTGLLWDATWRIVEKAVERGQARKERRIPARLNIDEKSFARRQRYETLVFDQDRGTVEYVVDDRDQSSLEKYYQQFTLEERAEVKAVAMDMWDPYIAATKAFIPEAENKIVFDKFHIVRYVTDAVDKVRRAEAKQLATQGDSSLKGTRHLWLANKDNVPEWRKPEFDAIRKLNLKTGRAWAIKEALRKFWGYSYPARAWAFFKCWYYWATHSKLKPIAEAAKTIMRHLPNVLTYFKHRITNALAEGLNSKIQMVKEMACGFRNREHYRTAIYFHCGGLDLYPRLELGELW